MSSTIFIQFGVNQEYEIKSTNVQHFQTPLLSNQLRNLDINSETKDEKTCHTLHASGSGIIAAAFQY